MRTRLLGALGAACLALVLLSSCNSDYTPRRRAYFKIDLPQHQYRTFDQPGYPYTFEYPVYANVVQDSTFFEARPENPYWINIDFPRFDAKIYISYKDIGRPGGQGRGADQGKGTGGQGKATDGQGKGADKGKRTDQGKEPNTFDKLRDDAFKMTFKHTYKATSIDQTPIQTANGIGGIFFNVGGNAATAHQFFVTDTTRHFLRGALYFDTTPNEDSLRPVNDFLQKDMEHLVNTFRWR